MQVSIAYTSSNGEQSWLEMEVDETCTVEQLIEQSGILQRFQEIDLERQKVGIYGKLVKLDQALQEYDRVEIYREITADPNTVPRREITEDEDE